MFAISFALGLLLSALALVLSVIAVLAVRARRLLTSRKAVKIANRTSATMMAGAAAVIAAH